LSGTAVKKTALVVIVILTFLLFSTPFVEATVDVEPGGATILVGQSVEFTAAVTDWGRAL
jgi:hypothetical protein